MKGSINIKELCQILDRTPDTQNIMLTGAHGIGKSRILSDYFEKQGKRVVSLFLGQMSAPGDLIGLPSLDESIGRTVFIPPYWFPKDNEPIVLFLDELNRARPEVLQTIMDLALNRKLAGRQLPEGSRIISAVNDGEDYQVVELDPALLSRFNVYRFCPSVTEWIAWARLNDLDSRVIDFIFDSEGWLDGDPTLRGYSYRGFERTPDRRAWERVSAIIKDKQVLDKTYQKLISGIVGENGASAFFASLKDVVSLTPEDVLLHLKKVMPMIEESPVHVLSQLSSGILEYLDKKGMMLKSNKDLAHRNLTEYVLYLEHERLEAMAMLASTYSEGTYVNAMSFIAVYCPEVLSIIKRFMKRR